METIDYFPWKQKLKDRDVYSLWKNADGTYEYVPALGAAVVQSETKQHQKTKGMDGIGRQTGGGGAGGTASLKYRVKGDGTGTSYFFGGSGEFIYKGKSTQHSDIGGQGGGGYQRMGGGAGKSWRRNTWSR